MLLRYNKDLSMHSGKPLIVYATQVALKMIGPPAVSDEVLRRRVSLGFSVVKDLTMDQYREVLGQKPAWVPPLHGPLMLEAQGLVNTHLEPVTHEIPSKEDPESISVPAQVRTDLEYLSLR
jgi:hypothetical protein